MKYAQQEEEFSFEPMHLTEEIFAGAKITHG